MYFLGRNFVKGHPVERKPDVQPKEVTTYRETRSTLTTTTVGQNETQTIVTSSSTKVVVETAITRLSGKCYVVDGDTIRINGQPIRLFGIDAPELHHPWGKKAKFELVKICKGQNVIAELLPEASYDRAVAKCTLEDGTDLSAEMVKRGLALDWPKFSGGIYSHLEEDGVRKKLWRVDAKHRGKFFEKETAS